MVRARLVRAFVAVTAASAVLVPAVASSASASPLTLSVSGSVAFAVLGHSCGGIQEASFGSGFDQASGYPDGDVSLSTTCSSGGRGSHPVTYSAWVSTTWDFTGALVSYATLASAPTPDPNLSVYDAHGNNLFNQSNQAYLVLGAGFVPAPRVSAVSPSAAPQGSTVMISGTGFTGATGIDFGSVAAASFAVVNDTSITVTAPAILSGPVDVTVLGPGGESAVNPADVFDFTLTPRLASLKPNRGSTDGGTSVTIKGVNFTGTSSVTFGGVPGTFKVINDTTIKARSPYYSDPAVVDVAVTSSQGTDAYSSADLFTYRG